MLSYDREGGCNVCVCVYTGGAYMHTVWRNGSPCAVIFKQRFPQQPHAPLVPLQKLRDKAPQLPLILMYTQAHAHTCTLTFRSAIACQLLTVDSFVQMVPQHPIGQYVCVCV